jgi:pSer/pThr/pTyr-binding forkhead associated (FHA) protein
MLPPSEYGMTMLLNEVTTDKSHRLVYMGNDYTDDVKINTYPFTIGKLNSSVNLFLNHPLISRLHATIHLENSDIFIEDSNSSNGTYLNGKLLAPHEKPILHSGDTLTFAHLTYMFK